MQVGTIFHQPLEADPFSHNVYYCASIKDVYTKYIYLSDMFYFGKML